ncbi:MAG: glycosyltransferase [Saprospiraceae bacterium]|nr:glycosyltransferase [Saprospiraceae bacterium]
MQERSRHAWLRTLPLPITKQAPPSASILIAARNEAHRIRPTLNALHQLEYPGEWEIIVVDDHSEDDTLEVVRNSGHSRIHLVTNKGEGKRAALRTGAEMAHGDILLFTDADCIPDPDWVLAMSSPFQDLAIHWISGSVISISGSTLVSRYDTLESQGMMAWTGAGFTRGHPTLAQGANMAIRKTTLHQITSADLPPRASGDDLFFLAQCHALYPDGCRFQSDKKAIIQTAAPDSWHELFAQRARWASKTGRLHFRQAQIPMMVAFLMSLIFLVSIVILIAFMPEQWPVLMAPLFIKILADHRLLSSGWRKAGSPPSWSTYLAAVFIHPFLVVWAGIAGPLRQTYLWKGRMVR